MGRYEEASTFHAFLDSNQIITSLSYSVILLIEHPKMVMTRGKDDPKELYDLVGSKDDRKELDRQFKIAKSNFKIAIVVDKRRRRGSIKETKRVGGQLSIFEKDSA